MTWLDKVTNPSLNNMAASALSDGVVTYTEMLNLFLTAATGGMTATKLADLKLIDTNIFTNYASNYVKVISKNIIYTNPGNAKWWGGAKQYSSVSLLGDLTSTFSEGNVNTLIGKWFLGTDLPMPISGGDSATGKVGQNVFSYATATGSLFVNGAAASDVNQGSAGDCYLVAALGAIAKANPSYITNMFTENANATFGVGFYYNGSPVYTTVNKSLPVISGKLAFAGDVNKSLSGELWVALAEKAYVQLNSQATVNGNILDRDVPGENSYQAVEGGLASPIKQITNLNYKYYSSYMTSVGDVFSSGTLQSADPLTYKQTIIDALKGGSIGWIGSWGNTTDAVNGKQDFVAGHAFMLLGYNAVTDKFIVRNPWGGNGSGNYNPQFEASITDFWNSKVKAVVALSDSTLVDPDYDYGITSNAENLATAVAEGEKITFTITRSGTGSASTVYLGTTAATAGNSDIGTFSKQALTFAANEKIKTITVDVYTDGLTEGGESFWLELYKKYTDSTYSTHASAYIKDAATATYDYTVASSAASSSTAVAEGDAIAFTITRSGSGSVSTVYLSTNAHTAGKTDFASIDKLALTFAANETIKTVTIASFKDALTEGVEDFYFDLYKNQEDSSYSDRASGYIKDSTTAAYNYTLTSNAATSNAAIAEGGKVVFTVTRSGTGLASKVYLSTVAGTATSSDYVGFAKKEITFQANQTVCQVEVDVVSDWWLEGTEFFDLQLHKNYTDTTASTSTRAYLKDSAVSLYNYAVTSNAGSAAMGVTEGGQVTFTIERSDTGSVSTVYVSTQAGSAGNSDYAGLTMQALTFAANETVKTVTVNTSSDALTNEGTEYFWLGLYRNYTDSAYSSYAAAYIKDAAATSYNYTIASSAGTSSAAVTEGSPITFTVTRSGAGEASTVYLSTQASTAGDADYLGLNKQALTFAANETVKTLTVNTVTDALTEGVESFWLNLYKNYADSTYDYASYGAGYIKDAAAASYSYILTSSAGTSATAAPEGGQITFTITRSGAGEASTVYYSTTANSAGSADYAAVYKQALTFAANQTVKTVTVNTFTDALTEGTENFYLDLFKNYADANYTTYGTGYIKDAAAASYNYTVTSSAGISSAAAIEGSPITFTVMRSGAGEASTVYLSTQAGTAEDADYLGLNKQALTFAANETVKTLTVNTATDALIEGTEYFWLNLYKNYADSIYSYAASTASYIKDAAVASYNYTVTSSAGTSTTAATEGGQITFTVTRSGTGEASTVYLSTQAGTAGDADYLGLNKQALTFAANETVKTLTVNTATDALTEGTEYFWLTLNKNYADSIYDWASYGSGYIKDVATTSYNYAVTSGAGTSATAVPEGGQIIFTITRSGAGEASTVYYSTTANSATSADYAAVYKQALNFAANETVKTVTVNTFTDALTEGPENFYLDLFKNYADADYATYGTGYIKDAVAANYKYTIASSAGTSATAATEGKQITFTITRSGSGAASTVYCSTTANSADSADYATVYKQALTFGAKETVKTLSINTFTDNVGEGTEIFYLDLFKNYADTNYATYGTGYIKNAAASYNNTLTSSSSEVQLIGQAELDTLSAIHLA